MIVLCSAAAALTGATAAALWRGLERPLAAAGAYAAAVLAAGAITANRYDVAVALTLAACLFFLARRHTTAAGAALGVGVALKLTPGMLLPLVLIVAETRRRVLYALAGFLVFMIVPFLPFLGRIHGLTNIITYHAQRPLQIESVPGTAYLIAGAMGKWGIGTGNSFGSQSLAGPGSELVARLSVWVGLLLVAGVYVLIWRRRALLRAAPEYIPLAALACVLAFTVCNKVLSPQFLCWTLPAGGAGRGRPRRLAARDRHPDAGRDRADPGRVPRPYWRMVDLESGPVAVVVARNVVLVAAAVAAAARRLEAARVGGRIPDALTRRGRQRGPHPERGAPAAGFGGARASRIMTTVPRPRGRRCGAARPSSPPHQGDPWTHASRRAARSSSSSASSAPAAWSSTSPCFNLTLLLWRLRRSATRPSAAEYLGNLPRLRPLGAHQLLPEPPLDVPLQRRRLPRAAQVLHRQRRRLPRRTSACSPRPPRPARPRRHRQPAASPSSASCRSTSS